MVLQKSQTNRKWSYEGETGSMKDLGVERKVEEQTISL